MSSVAIGEGRRSGSEAAKLLDQRQAFAHLGQFDGLRLVAGLRVGHGPGWRRAKPWPLTLLERLKPQGKGAGEASEAPRSLDP